MPSRDGWLRALLALACSAVIIWWVAALNAASHNAPSFSALSSLTFSVPEGGEVVIGKAELAQPFGPQSAETRHIRLRAGSDGNLYISRISELRGLNLEFAGQTEEGSSERYEISRQPGALTQLVSGSQRVGLHFGPDGDLKLDVAQLNGSIRPYSLSLEGVLVTPDGKIPARCWPEDFQDRAKPALSNFAGALFGFFDFVRGGFGLKPITATGIVNIGVLGGKTDCALTGRALIAMPLASPETEFSIQKNLSDQRLFITASRAPDLAPLSIATIVKGSAIRQHLGQTGLEWRLAPEAVDGFPKVSHFTAGRTQYAIKADAETGGWSVEIKPMKRNALFEKSVCQALYSSTVPDLPQVEDCPPTLALASQANNNPAIQQKVEGVGPALSRLFTIMPVSTLSGLETKLRWAALLFASAFAIVGAWRHLSAGRAAPGPVAGRSSWSFGSLRLVLLWAALLLAGAPEFAGFAMALTETSAASQSETIAMFLLFAMGALWICAILALAFDAVSGWRGLIGWFCLSVIIAIGALSLFTLSAESPNTDWARFFIKHKLLVLDILPLLMVVFTSLSPTKVRRSLGLNFAGRPSWTSPLALLCIAVTVLFAGWALMGSQQGLGGAFQPVEAGKFAIVAVLAAALAQWLIRARLMAPTWFRLTIMAFVVTSVLLFLLFFVPVFRSDYSPLIIIFATLLIVGLLGSALIGVRIIQEESEVVDQVRRIPITFLPKPKDGLPKFIFVSLIALIAVFWSIFAWKEADFLYTLAAALTAFAAVMLFVIGRRAQFNLALVAVFLLLSSVPVGFSLRNLPVELGLGINNWSWSDKPSVQIANLQDALGDGRRLPVERLMSWADLRFGQGGQNLPAPRITLRDMDFHVMRSRAALAHAPCGVSAEFAAGPVQTGKFAVWLGRALPVFFGSPCMETAASMEPATCAPTTLKGAIRPHCVPVVQSDFAATYLISRHGVGASAILVLFQIALALIAFNAYWRLQARHSRDPVETGADQAMALVALGSGILFVMQWALAWSNAFGLLPVMGQPMTWLSAGTSHHFFMAIPAALSIMVAIRLAGLRETGLNPEVPPKRMN